MAGPETRQRRVVQPIGSGGAAVLPAARPPVSVNGLASAKSPAGGRLTAGEMAASTGAAQLAQGGADAIAAHVAVKQSDFAAAHGTLASATLRVIHLCLFDPDVRLLLQEVRTTHPERPFRLTSSLSYVLRPGEDYASAAAERTQAQLGAKVDLFGFGVTPIEEAGQRKLVGFFTGRLNGPVQMDLRRFAGFRHLSQIDLERELERDPAAFSATFRSLYFRFGSGIWPDAVAPVPRGDNPRGGRKLSFKAPPPRGASVSR